MTFKVGMKAALHHASEWGIVLGAFLVLWLLAYAFVAVLIAALTYVALWGLVTTPRLAWSRIRQLCLD